MGDRGRPSINAMITPNNMLEVMQRPDAPYDLTDAEADEWRAIVGVMPADHFMRGNFPVLSQLCRHVSAARVLARIIADYTNPKNKDFNFKEYKSLLERQSAESLSIMRLCRTMRLTQQAVLQAKQTHHPKGQTIVAPWSRND